jgi:hypothetical protein
MPLVEKCVGGVARLVHYRFVSSKLSVSKNIIGMHASLGFVVESQHRQTK